MSGEWEVENGEWGDEGDGGDGGITNAQCAMPNLARHHSY
ncbi:hypothetical protein COO91_01571 [Nostoc flagelliforme CCNUN1]|uniref:Uncharacterized protein n=1 Tax=Nostoc flagelliforme CCNUN1 TaxID=2038116 RepID=A0A2K8SJS8_9NOSO|nr:hypothetical protein COO91_01571 [Nostoc flagelliforme CCNUN1]